MWGPSLGIFAELLILMITLIIFQIYKPVDVKVKGLFFLKLIGCAFTFSICCAIAISLGEDTSPSFAKEEITFLTVYIIGITTIGIVLPGMLITSIKSLQSYFEKILISTLNVVRISFQILFKGLTRQNRVQTIVPNI